MWFICPLCKGILKRDIRKKPYKGKKNIRSFCDKYGKEVVLKEAK